MELNFNLGAAVRWLGATLAAGFATALLVWLGAGSTDGGIGLSGAGGVDCDPGGNCRFAV